MKINEIQTEKITKRVLENYISENCSKIKFYGKCGNNIFLMKGNNTGVFNLDKKEFIIPYKDGIAYPVVDDNNNYYFMVITSDNSDRLLYNDFNQPRYSEIFMHPYYDYDDNEFHYNLECYSNIFDENNQNVYPINKYIINNHQFNCMLDGSLEYPRILYREDDYVYDSENKNNKYTCYSDLPSHLNSDFKQILSYYKFYDMDRDNIKKINNENKDSLNNDSCSLSIIYKKGKYIVTHKDTGFKKIFNDDINKITAINEYTILLQNADEKSALYDIYNGYIIGFEEGLSFDNAYKLKDNIYKLDTYNGYILLIKSSFVSKTYIRLYMTPDNLIIGENRNTIDFYTIDGELIYTINSSEFYKCENYIYYHEDNTFYQYNLKTKEKIQLDILPIFKDEDNNYLNLSIDEILDNYSHYYEDSENGEFILFKEHKYGIEIRNENKYGYDETDSNSIRVKRWFNSFEKRRNYIQFMLESLLYLDIICEKETLECKKKTKKLS